MTNDALVFTARLLPETQRGHEWVDREQGHSRA